MPASKRPASSKKAPAASSSAPSKSPSRGRSKSPAPPKSPSRSAASKSPAPRSSSRRAAAAAKASTTKESSDYAEGTNWVAGGIEDNAMLFALVCIAPFLTVLLGHLTSEEFKTDSGLKPYITELAPACYADLGRCGKALLGVMLTPPSLASVQFILSFMSVGFLLEWLPGKIESGPETLTGHTPRYIDNGVKHCLVFTALFFAGSNLNPYHPSKDLAYDFGIMYDVFPGAIAFLNIFGICFCLFLTFKGLNFPSTADNGSSGSVVKDFLWGTELYPRLGGGELGWDLKRFINCRFSMTFWLLAGLSYAYKSYRIHGEYDWGLILGAVSQYLYLFKFFWWEMGYMRSIDIIVDRAGFEIQWGCLVFVPSVYTLHSRFCVQNPSGLSWQLAALLFVISIAGVACNYAADRERDVFRASGGKALVWGKKAKFIDAEYTVIDRKTGKETKKRSLLLASGFWGVARHFQYFFELTAAWSWCLLANPAQNGVIPLFYASFLTYLLIDRANRDSKKCHLKYGKHYEEYCAIVPYKIIPFVY